MVVGGERSGGTGSAGAAGSGCGGPAPRRKKACRRCRGGGHETESLEERQRKMNAGKTWAGCRGGGWVENPEVHTPSPSAEQQTHNSWNH